MEDYRDSHKAHDKGSTYAKSFAETNNLRFIWEWEQATLDRILDRRGLVPGNARAGDYLDFACGTGRILAHIEPRFERPRGVDVSESMLSEARKLVKSATITQADLTAENVLSDERFDLITAFRFFVNAQQSLREDVMRALAPLLKDDGVLIFNIHVNRNSLFSRVMLLYKWLRRDKSGEFRTMSLADGRRLLAENGLHVTRMHHRGVIPVFNDTSSRPPFRLLRVVENFFSKFRIFAGISRYVILECEKRPAR